MTRLKRRALVWAHGGIPREYRRLFGWKRRRGGHQPREVVPAEAVQVAPSPAASVATASPSSETLLQRTERIVREGELVVERQRELVFAQRRNGESSDAAEKLLRTFQETLLEYRKNLAMLQIRHRRGMDA